MNWADPYSAGLIAMLVATAIPQGNTGGLIGFLLVPVSFWIKSSHEEEVMLKQWNASGCVT